MDYPYGYGSTRVTMEQLKAKQTWRNLHPEFARRLEALLVASNGTVGVGTAWRDPAQQDAERARRLATGTGAQMAPSDKSWHCAGGAVDLVGDQQWAKDNAHHFGLYYATWAGESLWHQQPDGLPHARPSGASVNDYIGHVEIVGIPPSPPVVPGPPPPSWPPFDPNLQWWSLYPLDLNKAPVQAGSHGDLVKYLQGVLKHKAGQNIGNIDGVFGPRTRTAVRNYQTFWFHGGVQIHVDGKVGMQETWPLIDWSAVN